MKYVQLKEIVEIVRGVTFSKDEGTDQADENRYPVIRAGSIQNELLVNEDQIWVLKEKIKQNQLIRKNDIIMCTSSGSAELVGKCAISSCDVNVSFGAFCVGLRPIKNKVIPSFIYHYLRTPAFRNWSKNAGGANIKNLRVSELADFEIPLPPLAEQKRIAAILDKADAIRQKRQQAIALADQFLRSVFLDMFGDPVTNPKGCKLLPMTEVFHIKTGKLNSNAEIKGGTYPFFTCAKEVYRIDHYAFDQEALLLAGNNAQADYDVKHYIGKFNAYQRTYVLSLKNENWSYPFFKFALEFQLGNLKNSSKGSNTKYITMEIMSRTMLPSPSPSDQSEFVAYFKQQMDMRTLLEKSQQESNALFNSLSQKAFSGQL